MGCRKELAARVAGDAQDKDHVDLSEIQGSRGYEHKSGPTVH
jgi:hypothetical protein